MGLLKALLIGVIAAICIATFAHDIQGDLGDLARWHSLHFQAGDKHIFFSVPIFIGVTLFGWGFMFWSRD